jgi:hypothetical protein
LRPAVHVGVGVGGGALLAVLSHSPACGLVFAGTTVLMDLDHAVDYVLFGSPPRTVANFFKRGHCRTWSRLVFALHSYELFLLAACLGFWLDNPVVTAGLLGYAIHLLMDEGGNRLPDRLIRIHPLFYFLFFRLWHGFRPEKISWLRVEPPEAGGIGRWSST